MNALPEFNPDDQSDPVHADPVHAHPVQGSADGAASPDEESGPAAGSGSEQFPAVPPQETAILPPAVPDAAAFPSSEPRSFQIVPQFEQQPPPGDRPMFQQWYQPPPPPPVRTPHFGHVAILAVFAIGGLLGAATVIGFALHLHLFGVMTREQAAADIHYTLGSEAVIYLLMLVLCVIFFPMIWHKSFFAGIQWNGLTAFRLRQKLFVTAAVCFGLALVNGLLLPGPKDAPIDKIFRAPGAAWLLFGFGVTLAPFFEEMVFRGFLLPAFCTAYDWAREQMAHLPVGALDETGQPRWSMPAMIFGSVCTSIPFALMHGSQTGFSIGPQVLLICVSLVLCWARLSTRSLASSVLVHASYNFLLFSLMLFGTAGFRHLDKM